MRWRSEKINSYSKQHAEVRIWSGPMSLWSLTILSHFRCSSSFPWFSRLCSSASLALGLGPQLHWHHCEGGTIHSRNTSSLPPSGQILDWDPTQAPDAWTFTAFHLTCAFHPWPCLDVSSHSLTLPCLSQSLTLQRALMQSPKDWCAWYCPNYITHITSICVFYYILFTIIWFKELAYIMWRLTSAKPVE